MPNNAPPKKTEPAKKPELSAHEIDVRQRIKAGLNRKQAEAVIAAQKAEDERIKKSK